MGYGNFVFFLVCEPKKVLSDLALWAMTILWDFFPNNFFLFFQCFYFHFLFLFLLFFDWQR